MSQGVRCCECEHRRDPYRPVFRRCDGKADFCCKRCWMDLEYEGIMYAEMSDQDEEALRRNIRR